MISDHRFKMAELNHQLAILVAIMFYATTCVVGMENKGPDPPFTVLTEFDAMERKQAADLPIEDAVSRQSSLEEFLEDAYNQCLPAKQVKHVTRLGLPCKCKNCDYHGYRNKWCYTSDDKKQHQYCCHTECSPEPVGGSWTDVIFGFAKLKWYCKASSKLIPIITECDPKKNTLNTSGKIPSKWDWVKPYLK